MRRAGITLIRAYTSNKKNPVEGYAQAVEIVKRWADDAQRLHSEDIRGIQKNPCIRSLVSLFKDSAHENYLTSKKALATFSGVGRSLSTPSKEDKVYSKAIENHKTILGGKHETSPEILSELGLYVKETIKRIRLKQESIDKANPNDPKQKEELGRGQQHFL
jgi:hypothetical protein